MPRKYTIRSKEEKLAIVKQVLAGSSIRAWEPEIHNRQVSNWVKKYQAEAVPLGSACQPESDLPMQI